ncbi:hypothetical protein FOXG_00130 [Fusarium oxysporum f. sp. lycopersici 4287]|uniref:Uncharacterized protein n=1 Tax=Fusarium oxysporum f. sp. lycopersici (strain 4287 / CBS 123668 / FGSC 9935 / NRRL 34936) TaxID=426428 RepID=A0A0J9WFR4_FUSO4|nr:hypothetical protein FOXG_00130 [Fusarium oxysporum f. sp. lycopersici 4287]KNA93736.1 hypothetical protein FOXG_00130 [Fusarium oxysporum f. sp. lycopersici 4287]
MERTASGPKTLFPRGPSFTLDDFSNKDFIVRDFVDSLAESAVPSNRRSGSAQTPFDPKPLIRTFENALDQLGSLGAELQEKESELMSHVRRAEVAHDSTLETLGQKLDESMRAFEQLDLSLNQEHSFKNGVGIKTHAGGNIALQIGEKLEDLDKKRRRANDAIFLIQCWTEVSETGKLSLLQDVQRQAGSEHKVRCAMIVRQLMRISQRLDPTSWGQTNGQRNGGQTNGVVGNIRLHNTREVLEKFCETLEQDLLQQFENSNKKGNYSDMMECAKVLYDFNGGASVIATFVNQHAFFLDRDQLLADEVQVDSDTWEQLADPDSEPPTVEPSLQNLLDEIKIVMQDESNQIKLIFPYYETVLIKFIQRIFQQSIQQRLEMVLDETLKISSLAFLRALHSSRTYLGSLVEDLKSHGLTEHPEPCSAQIAHTLDQQMEELFVPYMIGNSYIERERKSLEEMYSPSALQVQDAYIERLDSSELTCTQKKMMLRVAGVQDKDKDNKNEIEVSEEDGALSVANAKRMLKWLAESVQRTLELGTQTDTPKDVNTLLNLLLTSLGQVYIETTLDAALDQVSVQENTKTEPDLSYLPTIQPAVTITSLMDRFITVVLIRLAESNTTVRRSMEAQKRVAISNIEKKTNNVMKGTVDVVSNWVTKSLAGQRKQDFRPKEVELDSLQTQTCLSICTFLARVQRLARQAIDGQNSEKFFTELALVILKLLFEHFKKFQVNATGGLMVTQDIAKYVSTMREWPLTKEVGSAVEMLTEIGSLFIVGPEALREKTRTLAASGIRGKLSRADFRAFVQRRDDSGTVGIQSVLSGL